MLSKLMALAIVILIVILVGYLMRDSALFTSIRGAKEKVAGKVKEGPMISPRVKITDSPVLFVKGPKDHSYQEQQMFKQKITFGSDKKNDIFLIDETVEKVHATLEKVIEDNQMYFELVNLSKKNPIEILNQEKGCYEYLGYKKGVVLEGNEVFYIGETKIIAKCPAKGHDMSKTERMIVNGRGDEDEIYGSQCETKVI